MIGEGWHERKGGPHAEVNAIAAAGQRARGATLYVTMEPCSHHGRTPPCVDAVLAAGITRVVAGSLDPVPEHGGGLERLRAADIETELVDSFEAHRQNEAWRTWAAKGRPFVTYKVAVTLDGRVDGARFSLDLRRGEPPARPRAARHVRHRRRRNGNRARRQSAPRRPRRGRRPAAAAARLWPRAVATGFGARAPDGRAGGRVGAAGEGGGLSRSCSKAGRRSRRRSWRQTWSTSCSCFSLRSWAAPVHASSATSPGRSRFTTSTCVRSARTYC